MARSRASRVLRALAMVIVSLAIALLLCETASRILFVRARSISWYHYDARYQFRHRSSLSRSTTEWGTGQSWHFGTNHRGFRGTDWDDQPSPSERRILIAGDSLTFGPALDETETYSAVAGRALSSRTSVVNLAVNAWGPAHALAYLETEGASIGASCLVYAVYLGNDIIDNLNSGLYQLSAGEAVATPPLPAQAPSRLMRIRGVFRSLPLYDWLLEHSQLMNVVRNRALNALVQRDPEALSQQARHQQVTPATLDEGLRLADAILLRMKRLAEQRFGAFALILVPTRRQLAEPLDDPYPLWVASATRDHLLSWASRQRVPVLDLMQSLPRDPDRVNALFFAQPDFHTNAEGHAQIGRLLAAALPSLCPAAGVK